LFAYVPQSFISRMTVPKVKGKATYKTFVTSLTLKNLLHTASLIVTYVENNGSHTDLLGNSLH
jgi:hypothetical protein